MGFAEVDGLQRLAQTLGDAADALDDPQVNADAAGQVLVAVDPPYLIGRLASTVRADHDGDGFTLRAGGPEAPYGAIVHARDPFLTDALAAREQAVIDTYLDHLDHVVDQIQGA